ncbi:hypothetical protein [Rubricoccus marinus]|uniref:Lipoprotein n=1 Tax=Rubricoccus marinus TaxID=716817 RepID=A0A259U1B5_9BACT|nr:hypothetical protein [Rubricoccus marinus]OZC03823.1 hypothetical protein BSZ36_13000 [Rubricoccus marinus]
MIRRLFLSALLAFLPLAGCSFTDPSEAELDAMIEAARSPEAEGVIVNLTSSDIVVTALDVSFAATISIEFGVGPVAEETIVRRGEAAPLHIELYRPGADSGFYQMRVRDRRTVPPVSAFTAVDAREFEANGRVVILREFNRSNL